MSDKKSMSRRAGLFLFIAALLCCSPSVFANGHRPPAVPAHLIDEMVGTHGYAILSPSEDGGLYLVWNHPETADLSKLIVQRLNNLGERVWPAPGHILADNLSNNRDWDAFSDGHNGLVVAWIENERISARHIAASGHIGGLRDTFAVSLSKGPRTSVVGAPDGQGGLYFVWTEETSTDVSVLFAQHVDSFGHRLWGDLGVRVTPADTRQWRPRVLPDGQGGLLVAWRSARQGVSRVRVQRLSPSAQSLWTPIGVDMIQVGGTLGARPLLASPGDGSAAVAWTDGVGGQNHVKLQRTDPDGHYLWPNDGFLLSVGNWEQWNPVIVPDSQKGLWIGWEDYRTPNLSQVFLTRVDVRGNFWPVGDLAIGPYNANQARLVLCDDGGQGALAAWVDNRNTGVGVYLQHISGTGQRILGDAGLTVADHCQSPQQPQLIFMPPDRAAVVWFEKIGETRWQLYGKVVVLPEFATPR